MRLQFLLALGAYPRTRLEVSSGRESLNNQAVLGRAVKLLACAAVLCLPFNSSAQELPTEPGGNQNVQLQSPGPEESADWQQDVDRWFGNTLVTPFAKVLFYDFGTGPRTDEQGKTISEGWLGTSVPFVVAWLMFGAIFLTLRMGLINLRGFWHALRVTQGEYDNPDDVGEVTHFQALASALSATIGLGNIAGVAIAVGTGGPGAVFWMIVAGLFGMTSKFVECTLAQVYRRVDPDGRVSGGPMRYLSDGLKEMGLGPLGKAMAVFFAVLCIGGSFGGGCAFQVVQSLGVLKEQVPLLAEHSWLYGVVMVLLVGIVIIGGIRRIAATAEKLVPTMCIVYVTTAITILALNYDKIGWAFAEIFSEAFQMESAFGGLLGVMVVGIKRAAFSNEAGIGSAAIAHSAAKTKYPAREGVVAMLGPFIDTVVICTMTGLVIVITGAYNNPEYADLIASDQGATLTSKAFGGVISWFPQVLAIAATLFAYSTMISWSYYGERCFTYLFGQGLSMVYRILFLVFVFLGSVVTATNILVFSDLMILSMALPNMLGLLLLSSKVRKILDEYWTGYKQQKYRTYQ
ncbi:MAG: alanine:cation symporter family protein [Planctomycetes bacterium]|nr:alanine:cation symporter family protein [Planctomycetota bacterium]